MSPVFPQLGHGIGLRTPHYQEACAGRAKVDFFEIISENFFVPGGNPRRVLRDVCRCYPVVLHGVSMSLGSVDPLDRHHLAQLVALVDEVQPALVSDHLCWSSIGGRYVHDLLPLPYTEEALDHVAARVLAVQDHLRRPILVENVSSYVTFRHSTMTEWEFLAALVARTGCGLLLDVNNVFVSAHNHGFDPDAFLNGLPQGCVGQIHLAGHSENGALLLDTHDRAVPDPVWRLYRRALARFGPVSTLIERDDDIPPLSLLEDEVALARRMSDESMGERRRAHG